MHAHREGRGYISERKTSSSPIASPEQDRRVDSSVDRDAIIDPPRPNGLFFLVRAMCPVSGRAALLPLNSAYILSACMTSYSCIEPPAVREVILFFVDNGWQYTALLVGLVVYWLVGACNVCDRRITEKVVDQIFRMDPLPT